MYPLTRARRFGANIARIGLFCLSIYTFIAAILLMKEGARSLAPLLSGWFVAEQAWQAMGFGWLGAYLLMSGSPVAAAALVFLDAGTIDQLSAYMMVTGSRLGASFFVFFLGFLYVLRGRDRANSLSMGLLSLGVTGVTYLIGIAVGLSLLRIPRLSLLSLPVGANIQHLFDLVFLAILAPLTGRLPGWTVFAVGLAVIMVSFSLFDRCLPQMTLRESHVGHVSRLVYHPWVMFAFGALITLISMSVSITLGLLLPLSNRGFIRRENVIPYIMGANVTTFVDTLLVAILLDNAEAVGIILASMLSIAFVSVLLLMAGFHTFERALLNFVAWSTATKGHLAFVTILMLLTPIVLILI